VTPSDVGATLAWLRSELNAAADPKFREGQRRYFKEPVDPYGVRTVDLHRIVRDLYHRVKKWPAAERNKLCTEMFKGGRLEETAIVCHLCRRFSHHFAEPDFRLFEHWLDHYVNTWANCDGLGTWLIAAALENEPKLVPELPAWTASKNRWRRRAAAVSLLREAEAARHHEIIFDIADRLAEDRDDMVEKGLGWLLKVAYPASPKATLAFILQNRERLSRTTLRYAAEKMTPADRAKVLRQASR
jgi:3-methyladenine DNA glycosylase AlkD